MRDSAILLCLLAALTGAPLRQAEAADDLSRSLAELLQPATIEPLDGGVGDDPGVGTLEAACHDQMASGRDAEPAAVASLPPLLTAHFSPREARRRREHAPWPPPASNRHHAWLQLFLF